MWHASIECVGGGVMPMHESYIACRVTTREGPREDAERRLPHLQLSGVPCAV